MNKNKEIDVTATVLVYNNPKTVFSFISDYTKDPCWRKEINQVQVEAGATGKEMLITETSFLSKKMPVYVAKLKCTGFEADSFIVSETTAETKFRAKNTRTVALQANNATKTTYRL